MDSIRLFHFVSTSCPGLSPFVVEYSTALIKAHQLKLRLNFLRKCLSEQVMPRSILPQSVLRMSDRPFEDFQHIILKKHIEIKHIETRQAFCFSKLKEREFYRAMPSGWLKPLQDYCFDKLRSVRQDLQGNLDRKLARLIENSGWTKDASPSFVVNLSDKQLDKDTACALGYGLSFACNKEIDGVDVARAFCNIEKYSDLTSEEVSICKGIVYSSLSKPSVPNCPNRFTSAFKALKKDSDLHITKADKSNAVVIMDKVDYISKMNDLLIDDVTYYKLEKSPLETVNAQFNKKIKTLLKGDDELIKRFSSRSPSLPYMYGLIKTHKPNNPARPIISSVGSVTYKLSKWLVSLLSPLVGTISNSNIKNNVDLVDKLNSLQVTNDFKLVSFDVKSLFTKVPVDDLLVFLSESLDDLSLPVTNSVFLDLIKLCIKDCKFEFKSDFYTQKFGMAMGNPLSPVLSNLYMEFFEKKLLSNILPSNAVWFRYVDDVLCLWPCSENIEGFLPLLNNLAPSIKFTIEYEDDCKLPFLDCMIHRLGKTFKFSVYRKPTNVCSYIHYYSAHHDKVKQSVFCSMYLRALRVCSPEFIDEEFECISNIGLMLKYPKHVLDKSLNMARKSFYRVAPLPPRDTKNLLVLPFNDKFVQIPHILKTWNVNVVFSNNNTVKKLLIKNSPTTSCGCIYKVPCKECNMFYVGQTGKDLSARIKQHKYSVRTGQVSNALFVHMRDNNHPIDWANASSIMSCNSIVNRNIIESSVIKHSENDNINLSSGMYKLDRFIIDKICKQIL